MFADSNGGLNPLNPPPGSTSAVYFLEGNVLVSGACISSESRSNGCFTPQFFVQFLFQKKLRSGVKDVVPLSSCNSSKFFVLAVGKRT